MRIRPPYFYLLTTLVIGSLPFGSTVSAAAGAPTASIKDFLQADYYQIEFFVFERPEVFEFNTDEAIALDAERALPFHMRTQFADQQPLWSGSLNPLTRACLTFPTLSYQLLPPTDALLDSIDTGRVNDLDPELAPEPSANDLQVLSRTVPDISPRLEPHPLLEFMTAMAAFEEQLSSRSRVWQPAEEFVLSGEARRLARADMGRVLFHGRWLQVVPARESPDPIFIQAGQTSVDPVLRRELEGTVGVTLGRYLHFRADLFFHAPGLGMEPGTATFRADGSFELDTPERGAHDYMALTESRRMRSEETHYLDHPKLGLVVRIDPVTFPPQLVEVFDSLEEDAE